MLRDEFENDLMDGTDGTFDPYAREDIKECPEDIIGEMFCNSDDPEGDTADFAEMMVERAGKE